MKFEPNKLHQGLSYESYAAEPGLRASDLKHLRKSPAHWRAYQNAPKETTDALEFGKLFHSAIERPEEFLATYVVEPVFEGRTKKGELTTSLACTEVKQARAKWYSDLKPNALVVRSSWKDELLGMLDSVNKHRLLKNLLKNGVRETSLWVEDPETGVTLKCRPDFISEKGYMVDIKTTRDASAAFFRNQVFSTKYDGDPFYILQAAHYSHCARLSKVCRGDMFVFVAIEKEPPYAVMVYTLDEGQMGPGEQWRAHLTKLYAECDASGKWPGYPEEAVSMLAPEWVELPGQEAI